MTEALRVVRELYAAVGRNDFDAVLALLHEDVCFEQADSLPFGGQHHGAAGFQAMAAGIFRAWPGFSVQALGFFDDGADQVVVRTQLSGEGLQMPMLELWTVKQGRISRCQPFYFDTARAVQTAQQ